MLLRRDSRLQVVLPSEYGSPQPFACFSGGIHDYRWFFQASMDHHKDLMLACAPKSPWKIAVNTSVSDLVVVGDDDSSSATDAADSDYWPVLNDVQSKSTKGGFDDSRSNKLQQKPGTVSEVGGARRNQSGVLGEVRERESAMHFTRLSVEIVMQAPLIPREKSV